MLFKKEISPLKIAIDEDEIVINGVVIDIPSHISVFEKLLGKPRRVAFPKDSRKKDPLYQRQVNYVWDRLGVYCPTKNGSVVYALEILMREGEMWSRYFPKEFFGGELNICGMPWEQAFETLPYYGKQNGVFKRLDLGIYVANGGYVKEGSPESGYMLVEIQLKKLR